MLQEARVKYWLAAGVEAEFEWPAGETSVEYAGNTFVFRPPTDDAVADVQLGYFKDEEGDPPYVRISRFLSILSWWWKRPARIGFCAASSARAMRVADRDLLPPCLIDKFTLPEKLPIPATSESKLALALYREAIGVKNASYEFLGYFRILNIGLARPEAQILWINQALLRLKDHRVEERLNALKKDGVGDIGSYLYGYGRCAVAHAAGNPVVDPDGGDDFVRLQHDLPVARALAEFRIVNEFNVPNWESTRQAEDEKFWRLTRGVRGQ
jgi:Methylamine utilization protein MauJ